MSKVNLSERLFNVAAGDAENGTSYAYIDMRNQWEGVSIQGNLTPDTGSITVTIEATSEELGSSDNAKSDLNYVDVSTDVLGAANKTASFLISDDTGVTGRYNYFRVKVVVAEKTASTTYSLWCTKS